MKRILLILIALIIISLLLCACGEKDDSTDPAKLPELSGESGAVKEPESKPGPAAPADESQTSPADSNTPASTGDSAESAGTGLPELPPAETGEEGGLEVVDEYTVVVSDYIGVGGN